MSSYSYFDKLFKDNEGRLVIWQLPNLPLIGWLVFMAAAHLLSVSHLKTSFEFLSMAFLFTWSYLEIVQGDSYFRRFLGVVVLLWILISHL